MQRNLTAFSHILRPNTLLLDVGSKARAVPGALVCADGVVGSCGGVMQRPSYDAKGRCISEQPVVNGVAVAKGGVETTAEGIEPNGYRRCKLCSELKLHDNFCMQSGGWHAWYCEHCKVKYMRKGFRLGLKIDEIREKHSVRAHLALE